MLKEELMEIVKQQTNLMVLLFDSLILLEIVNRGFTNKFECVCWKIAIVVENRKTLFS